MYYDDSQMQELAVELRESTRFVILDNTHISVKYRKNTFSYEFDVGKMFDGHFGIHIKNERNSMLEVRKVLSYKFPRIRITNDKEKEVILDIILFKFMDYRNYVQKHMLESVIHYFNNSDWSFELFLNVGNELIPQKENQNYEYIFQELIKNYIYKEFEKKWYDIINYTW